MNNFVKSNILKTIYSWYYIYRFKLFCVCNVFRSIAIHKKRQIGKHAHNWRKKMVHLPGYTIKTEIFRGENSTILSGIRNCDNCPVILKFLNREHPAPIELSAFIREYEIINKISGDRIIKTYGVEKYNNSLFIVLEDIGGESIDKVLQSIKPGITEKISLAIQMTQSLIQIHQNNIIHKDINPTNFIWNYKTNQLKIIDFGISAEIIREASQCINLNVLEGSLDYLSPEQTGRINRPLDCRTDLYSLGITFYELFTGRLPFNGDDELEKIYSHIAKTPIPPAEIDPEIPAIISKIVMKLISKTVEDRYQSALKLKEDLEFCFQLPEDKRDSCDVILGDRDYGDRFEIPHKLYGREVETQILIDEFEKAADGHCGLLLVSGYSGIGKSSLIHEIRKPITGKKGYFISGKYNQLERDIPYNGIIQAFRELLRQLLAQPQNILDIWKMRLVNALGSSGQVIVDIVPELEQIIGPQPPVAGLNPLEAKNRFQMIFREFINVFAAREYPLVIFLDDLQWCDISTLDLLKYTLQTINDKYILFIGAYRENEVTAGHPLFQLIEELEKGVKESTLRIRQIYLKPLEFSETNQLIADTFRNTPDMTEPLADIIYQKTRGNPFFISRLLYSLYVQGIFSFLVEKGQWTYDLEKAKDVDISDNVIDLLVKSLESLPAGTIYILKLAACIGTQFDLAPITLISKKTVAELGKDLWIAIEKEIVLPLNNNYRSIKTVKSDLLPKNIEMRFCFAHDRIRQSVYSLISKDEKNGIHLSIGREYLKTFRERNRTGTIFDLVNHLNIGSCLIVEKNERVELADLNTIAGDKAKNTTAFAVALNYFEIARSLLSEKEWAETPEKRFNLLLEQATAALLSGDLQRADSACEYLATIAKSNLEKGALTNIKVLLLTFQAKLVETVNEIRKTLILFNISLPESKDEIELKMHAGVVRMQRFLSNTPVEEIVNLPVMKDQEKLMAMQLLFQVIPSVRQVNPSLYFLVSLKMFELTFTYGISPLSCKCLVDCGVIQGKVLTDYKTGYKLGEAAFALINKFKAESQKSPVYFIFPFLSYWLTHYQECLDYYDMAYRAGIETGDLIHVTYAIAHKIHLLMWVGKNLNECKVEVQNTITTLKQLKGTVPLVLAEIVYFAIQKLQTIPEPDDQKNFEEKDNEMVERIEKIHNVTYLARFYQYNTYVNMILNNLDAAEQWNLLADKIIFSGVSDFPISDHYLFKALILVNKWKSATSEEQVQILEALHIVKEKLKNWADNCPANFSHKYLLLSAEIGIIENRSLEIIVDSFKKAIDSFGKNDFIHLKAFCYELYGKFWINTGDTIIGKAYIREADYLYKQWGAHRKVALLEKQYAHFFITDESVLGGKEVKRITKGTTSISPRNSIDVVSILKSTQAISSEIKIEKLLKILIHTMIENAGAQRGCLLLKNEIDDQFYIEAIQDDNSFQINSTHSVVFTDSKDLCPEIVHYVARTMESVVIKDACSDARWQNCSYIISKPIKSVLCMPVIYQNRLKGVVYLENNLSDNVFTSERLEVLNILSSQASISIENARLYENVEEKVSERTIQLNDANEKLKELSLHDPLTNLHNRRYAFEFIDSKINLFVKNKTISLNKREKRSLSVEEDVVGVYLIDIDHFKTVNDTYGHSAGDTVLVTLSKVLKKMIRAEDILIRWGGEEFLIILYNTRPGYLETFSMKVLKEIKETPIIISENESIHKTCSLGYVQMPLDLTNPALLNLEQMINISDYALYCAKENGRNCAARFLKNDIELNDELKAHLIKLSKSTKLNEEYFKIEFIQP
jgi:histidine kinase